MFRDTFTRSARTLSHCLRYASSLSSSTNWEHFSLYVVVDCHESVCVYEALVLTRHRRRSSSTPHSLLSHGSKERSAAARTAGGPTGGPSNRSGAPPRSFRRGECSAPCPLALPRAVKKKSFPLRSSPCSR